MGSPSSTTASATSIESPLTNTRQHGEPVFTCKGFAVGVLLSFVAGAGGVYGMLLVQGSWWGLNASAPGAIFLFFILTFFLNNPLRRLRRSLSLGAGDLVLVYAMMLLALTIPTQNFLVHIIPTMCVPFYQASAENEWQEILHPYIPDWIAPQNEEAIRRLYEGLSSGESIPWEAWIVPLTAWSALFVALSVMMISVSVILHRQWSAGERLSYPMIHLPRAMIEEGGARGGTSLLNSFFGNPLTWLGFALPFFLFGMDGLHEYIPAVPEFPQFFPYFYWFRDTVQLIWGFSFAWIGFFYLVSLDIIFSIWFFYLLTKVEEGIFNILGVTNTEVMSRYEATQSADLSHQGAGAFIVFALFGLWTARDHLKAVWRRLWLTDDAVRAVDDSEEALPYRACVVLLAGSLLFVGFWLWRAGMPVVVLPVLLGICVIYYIVITRVTAAGGIPTTRPPIIPPYFVISGFGTSILGERGLVALGFSQGWMAEMRLFPMIACANSLKLAEAVRGPKRRLFYGMLLAVVCSLVGSILMLMHLGYTHGGINLIAHFIGDGHQWHRMTPLFDETREPNLRGWMFTGIGGVVEGLLMWANHRWTWWPLHPLGFVVAAGFITGQIWLSAMIAWMLKMVIFQYGGGRLFVRLRPVFLGMILGEASTGGLWLVIDAITGNYGNRITAM